MILAITSPNMKFLGPPSSGSAAGTTWSRNRFGQYTRNRRAPVNPNSVQQGVVRARMAANAAAWRALTDAQRAGWSSLGSFLSRSDSLGSSYTLNGFMAYCSINNNRVAAGDAVVSAAPTQVTPSALLTVTLTLSSVAFSVAYTATPLSAGSRLFTYVTAQGSAGRNYFGDYRLLAVSAAAAASPANILAAYTAKFGVPVTGNRVGLSLAIYNSGFLSGPFVISQVVA
jgi:hypothetical protein